jgi:radical SAM superfamily enzyme with C-terminal helix-hairpin-helix motif
MKVVILDGYVDEPSNLGVPPYISPHPRYLAGAIREAGQDYGYLTIDEVRKGSIPRGDILCILGGAVVPGKYLRGMPISGREAKKIAWDFAGPSVLGGPIARFGLIGDSGEFDFISKKDVDAGIFDLLTTEDFSDRNRTLDEWNRWALRGANLVANHPDFPQPLIAELDSYRGCIRYRSGGCSFCIEPQYGEPIFRDQEDIIEEVGLLAKSGVTNFRLGGQSCMFSYKVKGLNTSNPRPNVGEIGRLLKGIRRAAKNLKVLHTDNADPAMIADNPEESEEIIRLLLKHCTSGNVLSFGMESADPKVIEANNLNATPDQILEAIKLVNRLGKEKGDNGMPDLLPGINFISGLPGETKNTYKLNHQFLMKLLDENLLARRINIRQVNPVRMRKPVRKYYREFRRFKELVRRTIDREMLKRLVPKGTVLKHIYLEMHDGKKTFGRQIGSYPLLVGLPYKSPLERYVDVSITSHGYRSITGFEVPLDINKASLDEISAVPDIGKKRALRIAVSRPFKSEEEFVKCLDDPDLARDLMRYLKIK